MPLFDRGRFFDLPRHVARMLLDLRDISSSLFWFLTVQTWLTLWSFLITLISGALHDESQPVGSRGQLEYAIGACIYACMQGYPPNDAPQRIEKDRLGLSLSRLRNVYSDNLIEVTEWCMSLDPLARPQSVFALQKELARETERRYSKLTFAERVKLQLENLKSGAKA